MKLIKLEINNFRQFYGNQSIDFSIDPNKGVTLIHGENNGGKTALLNALRWCLYEETTENLLDNKNLLNKHAEVEGRRTFSVFLQLEHDGRLLEVRRIKSHINSKSNLQVFEIIDGCYAECSEENPNTLINTFLPKEMSQYFFYQGEGTGTLSSQNDFSHIRDAIDKVLGLTVAKTTVKHLNRIKSDYQKDLKQYDTGNEINALTSNKDVLVASLVRNEADLEKKKLVLEVAEKEFENQISKLSRFDKTIIEDKIKLRDQKLRMKHDYERALAQLVSDKSKQTLNWGWMTFSEKLSKFDPSLINTEELNKSLRYSVDKQLLNEILDNYECICGASVHEDSHAAKLIEELGKHAVDPDLKKRWSSIIKLQEKLSKVTSPRNVMQQILNDIDDCEERIHDLDIDIQELSLTIRESDIDDIKVIEQNKDIAKRQCDLLHQQIPQLEQQIKKQKIDIKDIDKRISLASSTQPKAIKVKNLILAAEKIADLYEHAIQSSQEGVDMILLNKMQALFSQVAFNGYTVRKDISSRSDGFTWVIVDKDEKRVAAGNGYQAMLSISFIIALIEFSKDRANNKQHLLTPGTIAPFIADSILAFIGPDNGRELVRYIADRVDQAIFMFSQAQWTETHTDVGIRPKIGKEYNLVQHTVLTENEFKGQYPTHLSVQGKIYDVVRFGSDFDKVTIEEVSISG
ncbi:AAA family ATPase [Aliivibrio fischeri]|uniref:AAA family ATPase n=1 Tax=Aliivibrio fischeri TaxID=668 RepID=UPI001F2F41A1|nr:AAA family ATPase [Aliivibrio fischeri]MCE7535938.1 AAA family ATPase [Aliivibrio fischeri]MCE7558600.1 AAA family ATPase [Aliivibrio fischeri]